MSSKNNLRMIKLSEVNEHKSKNSCWIIVNKKVYDVTLFLNRHPPGPSSILRYAGIDATAAFSSVHHSPNAKNMMATYYIGELENSNLVGLSVGSANKQYYPSTTTSSSSVKSITNSAILVQKPLFAVPSIPIPNKQIPNSELKINISPPHSNLYTHDISSGSLNNVSHSDPFFAKKSLIQTIPSIEVKSSTLSNSFKNMEIDIPSPNLTTLFTNPSPSLKLKSADNSPNRSPSVTRTIVPLGVEFSSPSKKHEANTSSIDLHLLLTPLTDDAISESFSPKSCRNGILANAIEEHLSFFKPDISPPMNERKSSILLTPISMDFVFDSLSKPSAFDFVLNSNSLPKSVENAEISKMLIDSIPEKSTSSMLNSILPDIKAPETDFNFDFGLPLSTFNLSDMIDSSFKPESNSKITKQLPIMRIKLVDKKRISSDAILFRFTSPIATYFAPTSYIKICCKNSNSNEKIMRSYSPIVLEPNFFTFLVKHYPSGPMSSYLSKLNIGSVVSAIGPFPGKYVLDTSNPIKAPTSIYMVCGGTGIAPMLQIIDVACHSNNQIKLYLLFSNSFEKDILMYSQLKKLSQKDSRLIIQYVVTRQKQVEDPNIICGRITPDILINFLRPDLTILKNKQTCTSKILICGSTDFCLDMSSHIASFNVNPESITIL